MLLIYGLVRGHHELSGHLGGNVDAHKEAYVNLWFNKHNLVRIFRKHFLLVNDTLSVAGESLVI